MERINMDQSNKDLIANILLLCPHCGEEVVIEDFNNGVMITACQGELCNSKWQITIKIEEI